MPSETLPGATDHASINGDEVLDYFYFSALDGSSRSRLIDLYIVVGFGLLFLILTSVTLRLKDVH